MTATPWLFAAGLRGVPGLFVLSVDRADGSSVDASDYLYKIQPVSAGNCRCWFRLPGAIPHSLHLLAYAHPMINGCHQYLFLAPANCLVAQGDTLWLAADVGAVGFLSKFPGLELVQQEQVDKTGTSILYRHLVQAAVSHKGPLVGKTVRDVRFRTLYNAAIVAVHREGVRVPLKVTGSKLNCAAGNSSLC